MRASPFHRLRSLHWGWWLALALLLPAAQLAAASHTLQHLKNTAAERSAAKDAIDVATCASCVLAGAVGSGGAPSAAVTVAAIPPPPAAIAVAATTPPAAHPCAAYLSRAPPTLLA